MVPQIHSGRIFLRYLTTAIITLAMVGCTREPFDRGRDATFNEGAFDYQVVKTADSFLQVAASSAPDGRMAVAVASASREVTVLEESAGAWSEIGTLSGDGLRTGVVDISPADGSWWVLASHTSEGLRLFQVGGGMDATYSIPNYENTEWDSISAALATNNAGEPVIILRAVSEGLFRATMADTGWALVEINDTNASSKVLDVAFTESDEEYQLYRPLASGLTYMRYTSTDTSHAVGIPRTTDYLSLAMASDRVHAIGPLSDINILVFWSTVEGLDVPETINVVDAFRRHSSAVFDTDDRPYVVCGKYRTSERFDLVLLTRDPALYNINWVHTPILQDAPITGARNRMYGFTVVVDAFDTPHILFLNGSAGSLRSILYEAVPKE
jgi:hypothetical protein